MMVRQKDQGQKSKPAGFCKPAGWIVRYVTGFSAYWQTWTVRIR
jgi:hypothetical protein